MKKKLKVIIFNLAFMLFSIVAFSQMPPPPPADERDLPIDGGISLLLAAGVAYGVYETRRKK